MNPKDNFFLTKEEKQMLKEMEYQRQQAQERRRAEEEYRNMQDAIRRSAANASQMKVKVNPRDVVSVPIDSRPPTAESIMRDSRMTTKIHQQEVVETLEDADALSAVAVIIDADGYVFQRRNGEWFMAGASFGSTEFSGSFPAKVLQA